MRVNQPLAVILSAAALSLLPLQPAQAAPFSSCPTEAFLTQGSPARLYGVNLTSGVYDELGDLNTAGKLNAMGFNYNDGFLYAWYYQGQTLARIHDDFTIEPLKLGKALGSNYFVGDVAIDENAYYIYRKSGTDHGLWRIALDASESDYLSPQRIVTGDALYLNIYDLAFHPDDGFAYSVDGAGNLFRIDVQTGTSQKLGKTGQRGTFGAVYFDVLGTLYISRNSDGRIFNVDVTSAYPRAEFFSYGPSSSNNDGARCALAPVEPPLTPTLDFGDAPVSYGTHEADDGARHIVNSSLYLGAGVDTENRAFPAPDESDDTKDDNDDEDGLQFITGLSVGESAAFTARTHGSGYLSVWIDFNRDGSFSSSEQVVKDYSSQDETSTHTFVVPETASTGDTWARARLSSKQGLTPTGPAPDGEVEDYPLSLEIAQSSGEHYPSANGYVTLAYEDLWPSQGDYDMNDFVVHYRTAVTTKSGPDGVRKIESIRISGEIVAVGAAFHSGFGVTIPGLKTSDVQLNKLELLINDRVPVDATTGQPFLPLRGTDFRGDYEALFEITRDVWNTVELGEGCSFHRTESSCGGAANARFSLTIPVRGNVLSSSIERGVFNPFIFATGGRLRNSIFVDADGNRVAPGDALEVHLKNKPPSWRADPALLGRADDVSIESTAYGDNAVTYQNSQGLPWAIEIGGRWCHPAEYQDLTVAYPEFADFVASEGQSAHDWFYTNKAADHPQRGAAGYLYQEDGQLDSNCASNSAN